MENMHLKQVDPGYAQRLDTERRLASGQAVARDRSDFAVQMEGMEKQLAALKETAQHLANRLGPVLTPRPPSAEGLGTKGGGGSPLANTIALYREGVSEVQNVLGDLLSRLDL